MKVALLLRWMGSARTCPLWTSREASSEAVPLPLYSWLSLRCDEASWVNGGEF
jgi:hypothetical protein